MNKKILIWMLVIILLSSFVIADLETNNTQYLSLDNADLDGTTVIDSSENVNGTNQGATTGVAGILNEAFDFSGTAQYIDSNYNGLNTGNNFTASLWIETTDTGEGMIMGVYDGTDYVYFGRSYIAIYPNLGFITDNAGVRTDDGTWRDGNLNHIVFLKNGTTQAGMYIYINGINVPTTATASGTISGTVTKDFFIGSNNPNDGGADNFIDGIIDEVGIWTRALSTEEILELYNSGNGFNPYTIITDPINISSPFPTNNTQYDTPVISFNATMNTSNATSVNLYLNGTLNETKSLPAGTEVPINFSKTMNNGDWTFYIFANDSETSNETTATHEFYVDVTDPVMTWINPLNTNTTVIQGNLSSNITITDTNLLSYEYNITHLNGSILNNFNFSNTSLTGLTTYTIDDTFNMSLYGGTFKAVTRVCDGHTSNEISFPAIIWQNEIHFNKVKIYQEDKADTYKAIYQKERDRYTFNFETNTESYSKYFIVEGESEIIILNGKTEYKGHLIVDGRYWVDFEEWDISKVEVERITDNKVRVKTYSNNKKKDWKFKSIGELNCITEEVEFFSINYTQTFKETVLETSTSNFKINITGSLTNLSGNVTYNNTEYTGTRTNYVNHSTLSVNIPSPNVSTDTNITFNWTIQADSLLFNTSSNLQLVLDLAFDGCENNTDILLNLTQQNEELLTDILPTVLEVDLNITGPTGESWNYHNSTNLTSLDICLPAGTLNAFNLSTFTIDIIAGYDAVGYVQEFWNLDNGTVSNISYFNPYTPTSINLYSLNSTDSTTFLFTYLDDVGLSIDDGIIHTHRKYIGDGVFREVERSKQDNNGETHVHLVEEDVIYFFEVSQYGIILFTSSTYNAKCLSSPCQIELKAVSSISDFPNDWLNIGGSLYHIETNSTSRISTLSYESNASNTFNYSIFQYNGSQTLLVNSSISTGTSGAIDLTIPISYGNDTYIGAIFKDDDFVKSEWLDMTFSARDYFGTTGAILGGFIVMTIGLMAIAEGIILIIAICVIVFLLSILMLVDIGWFTIISIICAGGIIAWAIIKKKNG